MRYCKSTIFQANHNPPNDAQTPYKVVCDTAKVRFFKQITTRKVSTLLIVRCLRYCKSTIFQANHNANYAHEFSRIVVCDTAKVRFFKQITTRNKVRCILFQLFAILQKYDFSSKSQQAKTPFQPYSSCLRYCKSTIFQANHNYHSVYYFLSDVVCDTAKVRFFKQITTKAVKQTSDEGLFAILQKYDFSSKSQLKKVSDVRFVVVCDTAKVRFFKQITTGFPIEIKSN